MMEKDYSGILLCTDYDGTLAWNGVSEKNIKAIEDFMAHGGLFTLATGRANYEVTPSDLPVMPNAPLLCNIGARIYDLSEKKALADFPMQKSDAAVIRQAAEAIPRFDSATIYREFDRVPLNEKTPEAMDRWLTEFDDRTFKVVFWLGERYSPELFETVKNICGETCHLCSNREDILEITAYGVHKGTALKKLKELLGVRLTICAGDTNGDIPMLREADIGYAVENASDEVKAAADRITVHAKDHAIAVILAELDAYLEKERSEHAE